MMLTVLGSQILNPDRFYDHNANPQQNQDYNTRKPGISDLLKQKLIAGIQMTMPGAPMIYYGDEAGMWGGDDPDCRKPMVWENIKYDPEKCNANGTEHNPDKVIFNTALFNWYRKLISIRKDNKVLSDGDLEFFYINDSDKIIGYKRTLGKTTMYILLNNNKVQKTIMVNKKLFEGKLIISDLLSSKTYKSEKDVYKLDLMPYQLMLLKND